MNQSKNVIINNVNTTASNKTAEIKVDYKNKLFEDPINYEVAVLSANIDLSECPIMIFNPGNKIEVVRYNTVGAKGWEPATYYNAGFYPISFDFSNKEYKSQFEFLFDLNKWIDGLKDLPIYQIGDYQTFEDMYGTFELKSDMIIEHTQTQYKIPDQGSTDDNIGKSYVTSLKISGSDLINVFKSFKYTKHDDGIILDLHTVNGIPSFDNPIVHENVPFMEPLDAIHNVIGLIYYTDMPVNSSFLYNPILDNNEEDKILVYLNIPRGSSSYIIYFPESLRYLPFSNNLTIDTITIRPILLYSNGVRREVILSPGSYSSIQLKFELKNKGQEYIKS